MDNTFFVMHSKHISISLSFFCDPFKVQDNWNLSNLTSKILLGSSSQNLKYIIRDFGAVVLGFTSVRDEGSNLKALYQHFQYKGIVSGFGACANYVCKLISCE